jgi:HD-GYP domain-containing protein (c-di-GMP phosphodiesterase class II)
MLLCAVTDLEPGMVTGASILHPERPEMELLSAGTSLTSAIINRLKQMGVPQVWTSCDGTEDLDGMVGESLSLAQREVYLELKESFSLTARKAVTTARLQDYRQTIMSLVCDVIASKDFAGLSTRLHATEGSLFAHCAAVAYISVLVGFELESYIIKERSRLSAKEARDFTGLGLAGMLHDIGKTGSGERLARVHEVTLPPESQKKAWPEGYDLHPRTGYEMLENCRAPAATRQAVLMHHQRWDGKGWPPRKDPAAAKLIRPSGKAIHIFSRIVSAANVLDNLMTEHGGAGVPPVFALQAFASATYDGFFDPVVRRATLRAVPPFPVGGKVVLSDGAAAVVITPNRDHPCKPTVRKLDDGKETIELASDPDHRTIAECGSHKTLGVYYEVPSIATAMDARAA